MAREPSASDVMKEPTDVPSTFSADRMQQSAEEFQDEDVPTSGTCFNAETFPSVFPSAHPLATQAPAEDATIPAELPSTTILDPLLSSIPAASTKPALLIGISGSPCSGKSTLAYLLSLVFPASNHVFLIHQRDFVTQRHLLIPTGTGEIDVHSREAFDFASLARIMRYAEAEGRLPEALLSLQADEEVRKRAWSMATTSVVEEMVDAVGNSGILEEGRAIVLVEGGFLHCDAEIRDLLDVKILLRGRKELARCSWPETQGSKGGWTGEYFDEFVWKRYVDEHGALFRKGDVEGIPIRKAYEALSIKVQPSLDDTLDDSLRWVMETIIKSCRSSEELKEVEQRGLDTEVDSALLRQFDICDCRDGWLGRIWRKLLDLV